MQNNIICFIKLCIESDLRQSLNPDRDNHVGAKKCYKLHWFLKCIFYYTIILLLWLFTLEIPVFICSVWKFPRTDYTKVSIYLHIRWVTENFQTLRWIKEIKFVNHSLIQHFNKFSPSIINPENLIRHFISNSIFFYS